MIATLFLAAAAIAAFAQPLLLSTGDGFDSTHTPVAKRSVYYMTRRFEISFANATRMCTQIARQLSQTCLQNDEASGLDASRPPDRNQTAARRHRRRDCKIDAPAQRVSDVARVQTTAGRTVTIPYDSYTDDVQLGQQCRHRPIAGSDWAVKELQQVRRARQRFLPNAGGDRGSHFARRPGLSRCASFESNVATSTPRSVKSTADVCRSDRAQQTRKRRPGSTAVSFEGPSSGTQAWL